VLLDKTYELRAGRDLAISSGAVGKYDALVQPMHTLRRLPRSVDATKPSAQSVDSGQV
jgi:hypothetical protein